MITMTIMLPSAGWFADRFGNKRVYMLGLALFTLGSWLCGKASSDPFLIGARALQGVGSGIIQALGLAIVTREFKPAERGLALGLWSMAAALRSRSGRCWAAIWSMRTAGTRYST